MPELATPGSGLSLLKSKTLGKRMLEPAIRFPVDLQKFVNNSMRSVRRLPRGTSKIDMVLQRKETKEWKRKRRQSLPRLHSEEESNLVFIFIPTNCVDFIFNFPMHIVIFLICLTIILLFACNNSSS